MIGQRRAGRESRGTGATPVPGSAGPGGDRRLLVVALVGIDAAALALAAGSAGVLRLVLDDVLPVVSLGWPERHLVASALVLPVLLLLFRVGGLYDLDHILVGTREYAQIAHAATYGVLIALAASYFAGGPPLVSRSWLLLVWALSIGCVGLGRFATRRVVRRVRSRGALRTRVVIVGASTLGVAIAEQLRAARHEGLDVVGFLDEYLPLGQPLLADVGVIGRPGDLLHAPAGQSADEYILIPQALPHQRLEEITRLMVARNGPVVRLAVSSTDLLTHGVLVAERGSVPLVTLRRARLGGVESLLKYGVDLAGATLALVLLAPLALAVLVRGCAARKWPLLCRYSICGAGGKRVTLWLFETGVVEWLPLRGVPALLSVLAGQLSLVGPRPVRWSEGERVPPALWVTAVTPGLTGPWRLSGPEASLADQAVQDLTYVRNYSIWEDVRVLWETARRLRGARRAPLLGRWQLPGARPGPAGLPAVGAWAPGALRG